MRWARRKPCWLALGMTGYVVLEACGGGGSGSGAVMSGGAVTQPGTDVLTYKNDLSRSGQNLTESTLTPATVAASTFGLLRVLSVDGKVDAQPLYLSQLSVAGAAHNVGVVATEHDSVYALHS